MPTHREDLPGGTRVAVKLCFPGCLLSRAINCRDWVGVRFYLDDYSWSHKRVLCPECCGGDTECKSGFCIASDENGIADVL